MRAVSGGWRSPNLHAIQYYCALETEIEILLTRNLKDYKKAQISVMTAQDFINL
jgi:hypothetical protein